MLRKITDKVNCEKKIKGVILKTIMYVLLGLLLIYYDPTYF